MASHREIQAATTESVEDETSCLFFLLKVIVGIITAPYRRTFKLYTWRPMKEMRAAQKDRQALITLVKKFKVDKYTELQSVQVAASFCAGATLATLSWSHDHDTLWVVGALWYSSLSCSIWAVITSIQVKSLIDDLPSIEQLKSSALPPERETQRMRRAVLRYRKTPGISHWITVFIWQFPSMTMSYAWTTFMFGLTVYLCSPSVHHAPWSSHYKIAIVYCTVCGIGLAVYILSSVFVYVGEKDLEHSVSNTVNTDESAGGSATRSYVRGLEQAGESASNPNSSQLTRARGLLVGDPMQAQRRQLLI